MHKRNKRVRVLSPRMDATDDMFLLGTDSVSFFSTGMPEDRVLYLRGDIDSETASDIIEVLISFAHQHPTRPIKFLISSPGGDVYQMLAIYDFMQTLKAPIYTIGIGLVASAASILLLAGTKGYRFAYPHTSIMLHKMSAGMADVMDNLTRTMQEFQRLHSDVLNIIMKHTGQSKERLENDLRNDFYLTAEQAVAYGVIDRIITGPFPFFDNS